MTVVWAREPVAAWNVYRPGKFPNRAEERMRLLQWLLELFRSRPLHGRNQHLPVALEQRRQDGHARALRAGPPVPRSISPSRMRTLNRSYRGVDRVTDFNFADGDRVLVLENGNWILKNLG